MGNTKRRDTKGRVLRPGESQQKDGRYRYTYYINGKQHCFYSWKLEDTDRIPQGKHPCTSLRSQIKWLNKSREQGIAFRGNGISILGLAQRYLEIQNANNKIRTSTKAGYRTALKHIREDPVSSVRIDKFKKSDAKKWIMSLKGNGFGYSTISSIHGVVKPAFQMAVDDDLILKNPFDFVLTDLIENDSTKRDSLTLEEQNSLLEFIKNDRYYSQYYDAIVILFETGLRIAEFCGLTSDKIDMENRMITIDTQLHRNNMPRYGSQWDKIFENICKKYRKTNRTARFKVTPHICRHTFATNMAIKGMNPIILKVIMGHDDIFTTFAIYTHVKGNNYIDEYKKLGLVSIDAETAEKVPAKDKYKVIEFKSRTARQETGTSAV